MLASALSPVEPHNGWSVVLKPGRSPTWSLLSAKCNEKGCFRCLAVTLFIHPSMVFAFLVPAGHFWVLFGLWSITTSQFFSLEQHVANYFPPGQVQLINPQKVHILPHLITSTVKQEIGYPFSMTEFHNISHEQNNIKRIMDHLKSSFVHLLSVI